jgi:hypothetical protein
LPAPLLGGVGLDGDGAHCRAADADGAVPRVRQDVVQDVAARLVDARVGFAALEEDDTKCRSN